MSARLDSSEVCLPHRGTSLGAGALALAAVIAVSGCQAVLPTALPSALALGEDAKIAKQAKADGFPSPAEVGLTTPTAVP